MLRKINGWFLQLKYVFIGLITYWIILPYKNYTDKKKEKHFTKLVRKQFKKDFGLDPNRVRSVMERSDITARGFYATHVNVLMTDEEHREFLKEQLSTNANKINQVTPKPIFFFEPEIIDIHNENLYGRVGPSIEKLKFDETKKDRITLDNTLGSNEMIRRVTNVTKKSY